MARTDAQPTPVERIEVLLSKLRGHRTKLETVISAAIDQVEQAKVIDASTRGAIRGVAKGWNLALAELRTLVDTSTFNDLDDIEAHIDNVYRAEWTQHQVVCSERDLVLAQLHELEHMRASVTEEIRQRELRLTAITKTLSEFDGPIRNPGEHANQRRPRRRSSSNPHHPREQAHDRDSQRKAARVVPKDSLTRGTKQKPLGVGSIDGKARRRSNDATRRR